ncbi:hypothetical protein SDJN03_22852, partial [Cucurbita argyrosperma subsp. sororia]
MERVEGLQQEWIGEGLQQEWIGEGLQQEWRGLRVCSKNGLERVCSKNGWERVCSKNGWERVCSKNGLERVLQQEWVGEGFAARMGGRGFAARMGGRGFAARMGGRGFAARMGGRGFAEMRVGIVNWRRISGRVWNKNGQLARDIKKGLEQEWRGWESSIGYRRVGIVNWISEGGFGAEMRVERGGTLYSVAHIGSFRSFKKLEEALHLQKVTAHLRNLIVLYKQHPEIDAYETYLTLSLQDIANTVKLNHPKEAEMHELQMVTSESQD